MPRISVLCRCPRGLDLDVHSNYVGLVSMGNDPFDFAQDMVAHPTKGMGQASFCIDLYLGHEEY